MLKESLCSDFQVDISADTVSQVQIQEKRPSPTTGYHGNQQPLLYWHIPAATTSESDADSFNPDNFVLYVRFKLSKRCQSQDSKPFQIRLPGKMGVSEPQAEEEEGRSQDDALLWTYPVRLKVTENGSRQMVNVPCWTGSCFSTKPCILTAHQKGDLVYLVLMDDPQPRIQLHNNTCVPLLFGQSLYGVTLGRSDISN